MSEYGDLIEPYRVAPPKGDPMLGIQQFAQNRYALGQQMQKDALAEATRGFLRQQLGLDQSVDPFSLQQYRGEDINQQVQSGDYGMRHQDFQDKQNFANSFMTNAQNDPSVRGSNDPYTRLLAAVGANPYAANALSGVLGNRSQNADNLAANQQTHQADLSARLQMNDADNKAAAERIAAEIAAKRDAMTQENQLSTQSADALRKQQQAGIDKFIKSGGADISGLDPRMLSGDVLSMALGKHAEEAKRQRDAEDKLFVENMRRQGKNPDGSPVATKSNGYTPPKNRLQVLMRSTPLAAGLSTMPNGKSGFRNVAEHTFAGAIGKRLYDFLTEPINK